MPDTLDKTNKKSDAASLYAYVYQKSLAFFKSIAITLGLLNSEDIEKKQYPLSAYIASAIIALLIGFGCGFAIGYPVFLATGLLWFALLVGFAGFTLNVYLYFSDTMDLLHQIFFQKEIFLKQPEASCGSNNIYYYFKFFLLIIIALLVTADGIANAALAFVGAQGFLITLGATGLFALSFAYLFAIAAFVGNAAIMFLVLREALLHPGKIKEFFANMFDRGDKSPGAYLTLSLKVVFFLAALSVGIVASIALILVMRKDFSAFLISALQLSNHLATQLSAIIIYGFALIPETCFVIESAAKVAILAVNKLIELLRYCFSKRTDSTATQDASCTKVMWSLLVFSVKAMLIGLNAYGNGRLAGQSVIPFGNECGAVASGAIMARSTDLFGAEPGDHPGAHGENPEPAPSIPS